jgi:ABC-type branched-subunit amino acid transport system substrate-binding protein
VSGARDRARAAAIVGLLAGTLATPADPSAAASRGPRTPRTVLEADSLALSPQSSARLKAFRAWTDHAALGELVYVLRRPSTELGDLEVPALEAALDRTPESRPTLGTRLASRLALIDPERARKGPGRNFPLRPLETPWASPFRIGAVLPDSGDFAPDAEALLLGVEAGLASGRSGALPSPVIERYSTGSEEPAKVSAAFDWAARRCAVLTGGIESSAALMLATGARLRSVPLVVAAAVAAEVGTVGPQVFAVGPSGFARGRALARAVLADGKARVGVLVSSTSDPGFARGFEAECSERGDTVVMRSTYSRGNIGFTAETRTMVAKQIDLLFWDGDAREFEGLVRQLTRDRLSLRICGGEGLSPERHHATTIILLEGVEYVAEDWSLATTPQTDLAQALASQGPPTATHVRGYLAGRFIAAAVSGGALTPEEVADALAARRSAGPAAAYGFLDAAAEGAELAVYKVTAGKGVRAQ